VPPGHRDRSQAAVVGETRWIALDDSDTTRVWQLAQRLKAGGAQVDTSDLHGQKIAGMEIFNACFDFSKGEARCKATISRYSQARHPELPDGVYYQAKVMNHSSRPDFFGGTCSLLVGGLPSAESACEAVKAEIERLLESRGASPDTWR
jgi:hypothetical protein